MYYTVVLHLQYMINLLTIAYNGREFYILQDMSPI